MNSGNFFKRCEQCQRCQRSRCNCKSFSDSSSCISNCVENICSSANIIRQCSHLCNPSCIVCNRTKGINGKLYSRSCHHAGSGNCHSINTCHFKRSNNSSCKNQNRQRSGNHSYT